MSRTNEITQPKRREAPGRICAFWCRVPSRPNFGDALTPWIIRRLTGQYPLFTRPENPRHKYLVAGSVISYAGAGCTVWGAGIIRRDDPVSPRARLLAVRGPLTRARALECGASCPEIYGDPALLLPRLYSPRVSGRRGVGLIAHFSDQPRLQAYGRFLEGLRLIDIQGPIESVIDQIASCEFVASSSLHGIIASHAYGVPAVWIKFRDLPGGDDSKFHDYFHSIGQEEARPVRAEYGGIDVGELEHRAMQPSMRLDLEPLWRACPFRGET
ncbi:MAG TPA: polysaccharide pyruvyl transferase family protein [Blastocatellia bacterium]|nr:polysaccharide pyruvyl transferase family protein [Blastocatellia bacterium]